jgi:Concanavalin A-like lectin/glucanases superfamily
MPATIAGPELVAFYDFNDGTATDRSGRGNHGTLSSNPPSFTSQGYQGGALSFGAQQKNLVTIPVDINPSVMPQITMGGWFNSNSANVTQPLLSHDNNGFDRTLTVDKRGGGGFGWKAFTGSGVFGGAPVVPGQWTFVAMRQDNLTGNLTLDVDGRRDSTKSFFGLGLPRVRIGGRLAHNVWFDGKSDNIFIFRCVLSDDSIAEIRARGEAAILSMIEPGKKGLAGKSRPTEGVGAVPPVSDRDPANGLAVSLGPEDLPNAPPTAPRESPS